MSNPQTNFRMSLDKFYFLSSWGVFALLVTILGGLAYVCTLIPGIPPSTLIVHSLISGLLLLSFAFMYIAAPHSVQITDTSLAIHRKFGAVNIPLSSITAVQKQELSRVWRVMGVGGFYGAWGRMTSKELSSFDGYLTKASGFVLCSRKGAAPLVLTPDNPEQFVSELRVQLALNSGTV